MLPLLLLLLGAGVLRLAFAKDFLERTHLGEKHIAGCAARIAIRLAEADVACGGAVGRDELEISVPAEGECRVNGRALVDSRPETLEAAIRSVMPEVQERHVTLIADGRASHQAVVTAMDVAGRLGFVEVRITTARTQQADP